MSPLTAAGGSHPLGLSSGGGDFHRQDPLCLEHWLLLVRPKWLGHSDRSLAGELASLLRHLVLDDSLLSAGLRSLPLPKTMSTLKREPHI
jgi:hypothetical protein